MMKRWTVGGAAVLIGLATASALWAQDPTRWPADRYDQYRRAENYAVGMRYPDPSVTHLVWFHPLAGDDDPHRWYAPEGDNTNPDYVASIVSSPVVGRNDAAFVESDQTPYAVYFTQDEWSITLTSDGVPDPSATYPVGAVYGYGLEGLGSADADGNENNLSGAAMLWRHQLGSDFGTDQYGAPWTVAADAPPTVAHVSIGGVEKDYLFVSCGRYSTIEYPKDDADLLDDTSDLYTGFIYCIDPTDFDSTTGQLRTDTAIKWIFPLRYRTHSESDRKKEGVEWYHTGAGYCAPVVWVDPNDHRNYVVYQACTDGTILKLKGLQNLTFVQDTPKVLDSSTHEDETFRHNVTDPQNGVFGYVNMAPALVGDNLYFGTTIGVFYEVGPDGKVVARFPKASDDPAVVGAIMSSPAYDEDSGRFVFTSYDGNVYCVNSTLQKSWEFDPTTDEKLRPTDAAGENVYLWDDASRFDAGPALARVDYNGNDVLAAFVASANGVLRCICANGNTSVADGIELDYPVYLGAGVYAPPIVTFVDVQEGGSDVDHKVLWVGTQGGAMRAYQVMAFDPNGNSETIDDVGDVKWSYMLPDPQIIGGPCAVWDPNTNPPHGWVLVPGIDGYLWAFGNGAALFSNATLPQRGVNQGELIEGPVAVQPKVDFSADSPSDRAYEWGDTLKLHASDLDTAEARRRDQYGNILESLPTNPSVTFEISAEGIATQKVVKQMERDQNGVLISTLDAEIVLDPTPAVNRQNQRARQKIWLVPGARYKVSIVQKSFTETAWRWLVSWLGYEPDPNGKCTIGGHTNLKWSEYATSEMNYRWNLNQNDPLHVDLNDSSIVLVRNVNDPGTFTINNPLMLADQQGQSERCNPLKINGSINEGLTVFLDWRDPADVTRVIESAGHGKYTQASEWSRLWVSDRSNMYKLDKDIDELRMSVDGGYVYRFGGIDGVVNPMLDPPISEMPPAGVAEYRDERVWRSIYPRAARQGGISSPDYPDIDSEMVEMPTPWGDPSRGNVLLPRRSGVPGESDETTVVRPVEVDVRVNVPKHQPAAILNVAEAGSKTIRTGGYQAVVTVWVDLDGDNTPDIPGPIDQAYQQADTQTQQSQQLQQVSTPSIGQYEPYRQFVLAFGVGVDKNMGFDTGTVDLGAIPQGTLSFLGPPEIQMNADFALRQNLQVLNRGNVNLMDVRLLNRHPGDPSIEPFPLAGFEELLADSMYSDPVDWRVPLRAEYILCTLNGDDDRAFPASVNYDPLFQGLFTLHKPRVGETDTVLRIPDTRDPDTGEVPQITVQVPPGMPLGLYTGNLCTLETGLHDHLGPDPDNVIDIGPQISSYFDLMADVTEQRLTEEPEAPFEDPTDPSRSWTTWDGRYQVDVTGAPLLALDSGPCVLREWRGDTWGDIRVWFSTNCTSLMAGSTPQPTDPYRLLTAGLDYDNAWIAPAWGDAWWKKPIEIPDPANRYFTAEFGTNPAPREDYLSPSATMNDADKSIWLAWLGTGFKAEGSDAAQHSQALSKLFLSRVRPWDDAQAPGAPYEDAAHMYVVPDTTADKRSPKPMVYREVVAGGSQPYDWYWLFWDAGPAGSSQIYLTNQINLAGQFSTADSGWSGIQRLPLPSGMMGARDACPVKRLVLADPANPQLGYWPMMDVVYSGSVRGRPAPDLYLSRYRVVIEGLDQPLPTASLQLVSMGIFGETEVQRVVREGTTYYATEGVDWDVESRIAGRRAYPLVGMYLGTTYVRLTRSPDGLGGDRWDYRDPRTGIIVYNYALIGTGSQRLPYKTTIDPGAGTIRVESADPVNYPLPAPQDVIEARYVPRALRITMDDAADTGPTAFIDKLGATDPVTGNPGNPEPFAGYPTRLWVVWRKTQLLQGKSSGGIEYKTYRLGITLPASNTPQDPSVTMGSEQQIAVERQQDKWHEDHFIPRDFTVTPTSTTPVGPCFVDAVRRRVYFTEQDEGRTDLVITYRTVDSAGNVSAPLVYTTNPLDGAGHWPPMWMSEKTGLSSQGAGAQAPFQDWVPFDNGTLIPLHLAGHNTGQVSAFVDPVKVRDWYNPLAPPDQAYSPPSWFDVPPASVVWLFYTGVGERNNMDVYYTTLSPDFSGRGGIATQRHYEIYYP
jgi:hypothetical protein